MAKYFPSKKERILRRLIIFIPIIVLPLLGFIADLLGLYLSSEAYGWAPMFTFFGIVAGIIISPIIMLINIIQGFIVKKKYKFDI